MKFGKVNNCGRRLRSACDLVLTVMFFGMVNFAHGTGDVASATPSTVGEVTFPIREFRLVGNQVLPAATLLARLEALRGENRLLKDLVAARNLLLAVYQEAGYSLVGIGLPTSIAADGVVVLSIVETTVGVVRVTGNQHFSEANIRRQFPALVEGAAPNIAALARELFVANDNPARQATVNFAPPVNGAVDADVRITEANPLSFAAIVDSSGARETGLTRLDLFVRHANVFDRSHEMTLSYRTSPSLPNHVKVAAVEYQVPIPELAGRLQLSARYSDVNAGNVLNAFEVAGKTSTVRAGYLYDFKRDAASRHGVEVALAHRSYQPSVQFGGVNLVTDVNAHPVSVGYRYTGQSASRDAAFDLTYFRNLLIGSDNDDATYNASRATAPAAWEKYRLNAEYKQRFGGQWLLRARGVAQYTRHALIDIEELYVGGIDSVRGLRRGELAGDRGYFANLEVYTPAIAGALRFLGFVDNGRILRINALPGEVASDGATTWGLGLRFVHRGVAELAVDWAKVQSGSILTPHGDSAWNFRLIARF